MNSSSDRDRILRLFVDAVFDVRRGDYEGAKVLVEAIRVADGDALAGDFRTMIWEWSKKEGSVLEKCCDFLNVE